eukprot:6565535-Alexandrium_andersonii.AAC.1
MSTSDGLLARNTGVIATNTVLRSTIDGHPEACCDQGDAGAVPHARAVSCKRAFLARGERPT